MWTQRCESVWPGRVLTSIQRCELGYSLLWDVAAPTLPGSPPTFNLAATWVGLWQNRTSCYPSIRAGRRLRMPETAGRSYVSLESRKGATSWHVYVWVWLVVGQWRKSCGCRIFENWRTTSS